MSEEGVIDVKTVAYTSRLLAIHGEQTQVTLATVVDDSVVLKLCSTDQKCHPQVRERGSIRKLSNVCSSHVSPALIKKP